MSYQPLKTSKLLPALAYIDPIEGGKSNDKTDRGGATKWGISLRFLKSVKEGDINGDGHIDEKDIDALTHDDKEFFYRKYFFSYYRIDEIENQAIANRVFSIFIHMRGRDAAVVVQRACKANLKTITVDGLMGTKTIGCINSVDPDALMAAIRSEQASMYYQVVARFPDQKANLNGWLNRAYRY